MTTAFNLSQVANYLNTSGQLNLATGVYGTLPQANGGTGATSLSSVAVTSLTAGAGISLNASVGAVTITNTGAAGGATSPSSSTDVTLTNTSNRVQAVTMTTYGKRVILPDATTITTLGGPLFIIVNSGSYAFDICTADGYSLYSLTAGESISCALSSSASANANWITDRNGLASLTATISASSGINISGQTTAYTNTVSPVLISASALSSTAILIAYVDRATLDGYAVIATISGTTISYGTPQAVYVGTSAAAFAVAISSTAGFVTFNSSSNTINTYAVVVSGTTMTFSAALNNAATSYCHGLRPLDSTRALQMYSSSSGLVLRCMQHNGTGTITAGTAVLTSAWPSTGPNGYTNFFDVITIDTNKVACFYPNNTYNLFSRIATISGTTVTFGTASSALVINGYNAITFNNAPAISAYAYSATECGCIVKMTDQVGFTTFLNYIITVSGTGITVGTPSYISNQSYFTFNLGTDFVQNLIAKFTQLDSTNAVSCDGYNGLVTKWKYLPTIGWTIAGQIATTSLPAGYAIANLSSTSAYMIGLPRVSTNQNTFASPFNTMSACLLKTPT